MSVNLSSFAGAGWQFFDNNGIPLAGGLIYVYAAGTTTPATTYTTSAGSIANSNPIKLDAYGRLPNEVWVTAGSAYKFVLKDANSTLIGTYDNLVGINDFTSNLSDLSNTTDNAKGDALIGFRQSNSSGFLSGAVGKTVNDKFQDYISVKDFGAKGDGSTNDAAAFTAAFAAVASTGQAIYVPGGTYKINSVLSTTGNLSMFGDGEATVLDFSGVTSSSSAITINGSATQIQNISSASAGNASITFASAPSLVAGDVFFLFDSSVLWNSARAYYYSGEWLTCRGTSASVATLTNPLYDSYTPATVKAYKLTSPKVLLRNFKVQGGASIYGLIKLTYCNKPILENIVAYNENYEGIEIDRCYNAMLSNCMVYNKGTGTLDDYGLAIGNSQKVRVIGGDYYSRRHGISIGGGDYTGAVPNRDVRICDLTVSNDILSAVYAADMHGNIQDLTYSNCTIYNGGGWAGMDSGYDNCIIYNMSVGSVIYASEVKGGELFARNCKFYTGSNPASTTRGVVDVGGNSSAITSSTNLTTSFIVENCYVSAPSLSASTDFMLVANAGSSANLNIYIDGLRGNVNAMGSVLRTRLDSGSANSEAIVVDNINNFPSGTVLHTPQGNSYRDKPQRLMRQSGIASMTATSGTKATINAGITYQYAYSRTPSAVATVGGDTGGCTNSAGEFVGVGNYSVSSTAIRPQLVSTSNSNWTATATVQVNWSVAIEEI